MDGVALLKQAASVGLSVRADGDKLVIRGPRKAEPVVRLLTEHKPAVLAAINAEPSANLPKVDPAIDEEFEERSAIIEFEAGVPRDWAEGFARLCTMPRPTGIMPRDWQRLIDNAGTFIDRFASQAASLGWDTASVFGCHPVAPIARLDLAGLIFLIGDGEVVAIADDTAKIRTSGGSVLTYTRRTPAAGEPQVAAWAL